MRPKHLVSLAALLVLILPTLAFAAPVAAPQGNEISINTDAAAQVHNPVAAYDAAGNALVVWENDHDGIRGRYISANGAKGVEMALAVNTGLPSIPGEGDVIYRKNPVAVFLPNNNFLLLWTQERDHLEAMPLFQNQTLQGRDVFLQVFKHSGAPVTAPIQVNETTRGFHSAPRAVLLSNGDVFVAWEGASRSLTPIFIDGIFGRLVSTAGGLVGSEFAITSAPSLAHNVSLAFDAMSSRTLVTWQGSAAGGAGQPNGSDIQIYGQMFNAKSQPMGGDFQISSGASTGQTRPGAATDGKGNFLVLWQEAYQDVWHARVDGQFVGVAGNLVGSPIKITGWGPAQIAPSVAATPSGKFLAIWMEFQQSFPVGMNATEIDGLGNVGANFWVNQKAVGFKTFTNVATDGHGNFTAPYEAYFNPKVANPTIDARLLTAN
jgi:hypothetical protein